jgi:cytochrome c oxidase subunit III
MSEHHSELPAGHFHHLEPEQAYHASKLGMWIFLATEVHLFGGLFCVFALYRWKFLHEFNEYARHLNWKLGALNTFFLLTSSFFMVLAVDAAQKGLNNKCKKLLDVTIFFGMLFFVVKFFEYKAKLFNPIIAERIYPNTHIFWGLYYSMTALHAVHVAVGVGVLVWLRILAAKNRFSTVYYTPVEVCGLYWHLVDIVWIFLFPILYLLAGINFGGHH